MQLFLHDTRVSHRRENHEHANAFYNVCLLPASLHIPCWKLKLEVHNLTAHATNAEAPHWSRPALSTGSVESSSSMLLSAPTLGKKAIKKHGNRASRAKHNMLTQIAYDLATHSSDANCGKQGESCKLTPPCL